MTRSWLMRGSLAVLATLPWAAACASTQDTRIRAAAEAVIQQQDIPGLAIGLTVDGKQHFYSFGVADSRSLRPVTPDTLFELGSVSKTFTATLASWAQARGKLDLQAPTARYLPALDGSAFGGVSLLNLATHSAGGFPLQVPEAIGNETQLLDWLKAWQPQCTPGTCRTYANPSIGMLGVITAKALAVPFGEAMQQQLFPSLGLKDTYIQVPVQALPRYAWGHDKAGAHVRVNPGLLADEAYGVKSSARDLLHYVQVNLGHPLADKALQAAVQATRTGYYRRGEFTQDLIWEQYAYPPALQTLLDGNDNRMLQTFPVTALQPPLAPQAGAWVNKTGSTNGFGAYVAFIPQQRVGVVILANRNYPNSERVKLARTIIDAARSHRVQ